MKRAMRAGVLAALAGLSGCIVKEVHVGGDAAPCNVDADCAEQGLPDRVCKQGACEAAPTDSAWACLDEGPAKTADIVPVDLTVTTISGVPATNATVRVCPRLQPEKCLNPIGPPVSVDVAGGARLDLPQDFSGFFEIYGPQGPDADDPDFVRTIVYLPLRDIVRGGGRRVTRFTKDDVSALTAIVGGSFDEYTGLLLTTAVDCTGEPAPGISFGLVTETAKTPQTKSFYIFDGLPILDGVHTDALGTGGFTNLKFGTVGLAATINAQQRQVTSAQGVSTFVRQGWVTTLYVSP